MDRRELYRAKRKSIERIALAWTGVNCTERREKASSESHYIRGTLKWRSGPQYISALARFRCSNHNLAIETQRGKTVREHRFGKLCMDLNIKEIEDEFHILMVYPLYEHIRHYYSIFFKY